MSSIILRYQYGLGDQIVCNGLVREYCKKYDKVAVFAIPQNFKSVVFMYRDLKNLRVITGDDTFAKNFILNNFTVMGKDRYDEVKLVGFDYLNHKSNVLIEKQIYNTAGVDFAKKWDNFFVARDLEREQAFFEKVAPNDDYVFLHEDAKRKMGIDKKFIDKKYKIFSPDVKLTENIFDYCTIIEKAKEIHVIDSSFMFLIDCLKYENPNQKLFIHRYARENRTWMLPILKKNWRIVTLEYNQWEPMKSFRTLLYKLMNQRLLKGVVGKIYAAFGFRTWAQKMAEPNPDGIIRRYVPGKSFVEITCSNESNGANSFVAEEAGATKVTMVDAAPASTKFLSEKKKRDSAVEFIPADINLPAAAKKIGTSNVVFCSGGLDKNPDPLLFLTRLRAICDDTLILHTTSIPEMPGLRNMAVFYPFLEEKQKAVWQKNMSHQNAANSRWGLTPSCIESLLRQAGFEVQEKQVLPFEASFVCKATSAK